MHTAVLLPDDIPDLVVRNAHIRITLGSIVAPCSLNPDVAVLFFEVSAITFADVKTSKQ